ncbi:hypothetical protein [Nonomuraea sp. NPDC049646]|uniref:hypothetical protein n=1 Tax=unclassified Nonomuraea TaxID=2593643 RepID=UPI00378D14BB
MSFDVIGVRLLSVGTLVSARDQLPDELMEAQGVVPAEGAAMDSISFGWAQRHAGRAHVHDDRTPGGPQHVVQAVAQHETAEVGQ